MSEPQVTQIVDHSRPKSAETHLREWRQREKDREARWGRQWNRPCEPVLVEEDYENAMLMGGQLRPSLHITYGEYDIGRLKEGRLCLRCQTPQEEGFPVECSLCGYAIREYQARDFRCEFEGAKHVGPTTSLTEEYEGMIDRGQRKRHVPGSQILTPSREIILPAGVRVDST